MCEHPAYWASLRRQLPNLRSLDGEFGALASGADGEDAALLSLPEPTSWLEGFSWEDDPSGGADLQGGEEFQKVVADCKRLSARAQSLLAEHKAVATSSG